MNIHVARPGTWSESEIQLLREKWRSLSSRELMQFLPGKSRSAIIAKASRIGLNAKRQVGYFRWKKVPKIEPDKIWFPLENKTPVTLLDRKPSQCAWPLDIPHEIGSAFVCGDWVRPDHVYCTAHCRVAYVAPVKRPTAWRA